MTTVNTLPGAPFFGYRQGQLCAEDVRLADLAAEHGTPLFVYSQAAILHALGAYQRGLAGRDALICYAMKANSSLSILKLLAQAGCGFDIVSVGELERALAVGAAPQKIVFSGVASKRAISSTNVVFPEPTRPTSPQIVPLGTAKLTSASSCLSLAARNESR